MFQEEQVWGQFYVMFSKTVFSQKKKRLDLMKKFSDEKVLENFTKTDDI